VRTRRDVHGRLHERGPDLHVHRLRVPVILIALDSRAATATLREHNSLATFAVMVVP